VKIIQIDEAALREGLPIRKRDWAGYLNWAVEAFRLSASGVAPRTQIQPICAFGVQRHHRCRGAMDADVISIETSRSAMELLDAFVSSPIPTTSALVCMTSILRACPASGNGKPCWKRLWTC